MVCLNHAITGFLGYASPIEIFRKKNLNSFERSWFRDQYLLFSLKEGKIQFIWAWLCCHFEIRSRKSRVANPESGMLVRSGPVHPSRIQLRVIWPVLLRMECNRSDPGLGFSWGPDPNTGFLWVGSGFVIEDIKLIPDRNPKKADDALTTQEHSMNT